MKCEQCTDPTCGYRNTAGNCYYDNLIPIEENTTYTKEQLDALVNLGNQWDWIKFRNEAALRIYCAELSNSHVYIRDHNTEIKNCIKRADELIKQLKGND